MGKRKALVIIDMQNDFIDENVLGNKETVAVVSKVVEKIKSEEWARIYATLDTHYNDYLETQEGRKLPVKHCIEYTEGHNMAATIYNTLEHGIIPWRPFYKETFGCSMLADEIEYEYDIYDTFDEVVLVGVCTDICVISNALLIKTICPGIPIIIDANCCAGTSPESHKRALEAMKMCQIEIINEEV